MALSNVNALSWYQSDPANWASQFGGRYVDTSDFTGWTGIQGERDSEGNPNDPIAVGYDGRRVYAGPEAAYLKALANEGYAPVSDLNQFQAQLPYAQQTNGQMFPDFQSYLQYMYGPGAEIVNDPNHGQLVKAANPSLALNPNHVTYGNGDEGDFIDKYGPLIAVGGFLGVAGAFGGLAGGVGASTYAPVAEAAYSPVNALLGGAGNYGLAGAGAGVGGVGTSGLGLSAGGGLGLAQTAASGGALTGGLAGGTAAASGLTGGGMSFLDDLFSAKNLANFAGNAIGGIANYFGSQKAADTQANSAANANNALLSMYNQNRADMEPYRNVGVSALGDLARQSSELTRPFGMSDFQADPGYNFRLSEGLKAVERSNAARGLLMSGGNLKGINNYAQGAASQEYGNAYNRYQLDQGNKFNRLAALAGIGQTANQQLAGLGAGTAQGVANNLTSAGNAQAAGQVGGMNAITGAIGNTLNTVNQNALLSQLLGSNNRGSSYAY